MLSRPMLDRTAFWGISYYAILIVAAIIIGYFISTSRARKYGLPDDIILNLLLLGIPLAIICARLYYVFFRFSYYAEDPLSIFNIREGGLAIFGGVLGGLIAAKIVCSRANVRMADLLDAVAPSLILGQAIGRWGNYINMEAYGLRVEEEALQFFPFAVEIPVGTFWYWQMATFFYEFCWNLIVFLILWFLIQENRKQKGDVFRWYILLYSCGRAVIEGLRNDSLTFISDFVRINQIVAGILALGVILIFAFRMRDSFSLVFLLPVITVVVAIVEVALGEFERNAYSDLFYISQALLLVLAVLVIVTMVVWNLDCRHFDFRCFCILLPNVLFFIALFAFGFGRVNEDNTYFVTFRQIACMIQVILSGYLLCYHFCPGNISTVLSRKKHKRAVNE